VVGSFDHGQGHAVPRKLLAVPASEARVRAREDAPERPDADYELVLGAQQPSDRYVVGEVHRLARKDVDAVQPDAGERRNPLEPQ